MDIASTAQNTTNSVVPIVHAHFEFTLIFIWTKTTSLLLMCLSPLIDLYWSAVWISLKCIRKKRWQQGSNHMTVLWVFFKYITFAKRALPSAQFLKTFWWRIENTEIIFFVKVAWLDVRSKGDADEVLASVRSPNS